MMKKLFALALVFLVTNLSGFAQEDKAEEVEKLRSHIKAMYESYISGPSTIASEEEFLKLFDRKFEGSNVQVDVRGIVNIEKTNLGTTLDDYKTYRNDRTKSIKFTVNKFHKIDVIGNTGIAALDITFEVFKDQDLISKGDQSVSMTLQKIKDNWKVTFISRLYVESEKYVGNCVCEIASFGTSGISNTGKFTSFLTVPDGDEYIELNDRFNITGNGEKRTINRNGDDIYSWNITTGEITKNSEVIGNARTNSTAIKNVLKYSNSERCQRIE